MGNSKGRRGCQHQEKLRGKPRQCSPEQIKEYHSQVAEHPCVRKK